jgi:hypothetical protein
MRTLNDYTWPKYTAQIIKNLNNRKIYGNYSPSMVEGPTGKPGLD